MTTTRDDRGREGEGAIDLSALDPAGEREGRGPLLRRVRAATAVELRRRRAALRPGDLIVFWRTPILATAGLLAVAAVAALLLAGETAKPSEASSAAGSAAAGSPAEEATTAGSAAEGSLVETLGVPPAWADWVQVGKNPTPAELMEAMEETP